MVKKNPHVDTKVQVGYMVALDKLVPNDSKCDPTQDQWYINREGEFGENHIFRELDRLLALRWRYRYGNGCPNLQQLAVKVLA